MKTAKKNDAEFQKNELIVLPPISKTRGGKIKLNSLADIRRELASLYREAKAGYRDINEASKLTFILNALGRCIEAEQFEKRIGSLEMTVVENGARKI